MSITVDSAIEDFVEGKGKGIPSYEVCEKLVETEDFNGLIVEAIKKGIKKMVFMPYGESLMIAYEPIYTGPCSTSIVYTFKEDPEKKIVVCFDRN